MNTDQTLSKETQLQVWALEALAQIFYFLKVNIDTLPMIARKLPASPVKDFVIYFNQNQLDWKRKGEKAMKNVEVGGVKLLEGLNKDLESSELWAFMDIISNLKAAHDMEGLADVVKELKELENVAAIFPNIQALARNQKNKEKL